MDLFEELDELQQELPNGQFQEVFGFFNQDTRERYFEYRKGGKRNG